VKLPFVCLLASLMGCAPNRGAAYERAFAEADRAETEGHYDAAARGFDAAASRALLPRDRTHAVYLAALMYERAGDLAAARERYRAMANVTPPAEDSAAAAYKEADMEIAHGDAPRGWQDMEAMLLRFPNDGLGKSAFHRVVRHEDDTGGAAASLAWLRAHESALGTTDRAEEVAYETAAHLETLGQLAEARDVFVRTAARWRYPQGALWDDALYRAAVLDERLGRPREALVDLDAMLSQREASILNGSYTRPRYPEATMLAARIWRDDLHDASEARKMFRAAYANFPSWEMRDQALWLEADLWKTEGRVGEECGTLAKLVREVPDSRYVACATERCSAIVRPQGSHAPTTCHPYIDRPVLGPGLEHAKTDAGQSP
jgi:tetratricopeptide (TPR) repeat protein